MVVEHKTELVYNEFWGRYVEQETEAVRMSGFD